jgi:3',5'-cyclic AMP phosphodiesterase CpdA
MGDDRRGDAYMNGVAIAAATCPWVPIMGNHESSDGDHYNRYLNQTWGEAFANPDVKSSATSALGHLLSKGALFGAASHGAAPSGTSRYLSVDIGLIHLVGLDLNAPETSPRTIGLDDGQLAWLEQDLAAAAANRENVPWIVVTSHFPIYLSSAGLEPARSSAAWYLSDQAEAVEVGSGAEFRSCESNSELAGCRSVAETRTDASTKLEPLFIKYGVDLYGAGHSHLYGVTWPMKNGAATQKNYLSPKATVYLTEGNGGVPGAPGVHTFTHPAADWMRIGATGGAYGRLITSNSSVLTYEHVFNNGNDGAGEVMETWSIVQPKHSPKFSF